MNFLFSLCATVATLAASHAATITVTSVADDVYVNAAGQVFSDGAFTTPVSPAYCTLRMALSAANLDVAVGPCAAGSGVDDINFLSSVFTTTFPAKVISLNPAERMPVGTTPSFTNNSSILLITRPVTITGPGAGFLNIRPANTTVARYRILGISDGDTSATPIQVSISGVQFSNAALLAQIDESTSPPTVRARATGGCVASFESLNLSDVRFSSCSAQGTTSVTNASVYTAGAGGALFVGVASATAAKPSVSLNAVAVSSSRALPPAVAYVTGPATGGYYGGIGGGVSLSNIDTVAMNNMQISSSTANLAGCLNVNDATSVTLADTTLSGCLAFGSRNTQPVGAPDYFENNDLGYNGGFRIRRVQSLTTTGFMFVAQSSASSDRGGGEIRDINLSNVAGGGLFLNNLTVQGNQAGSTGGSVGGIEVRAVRGTGNFINDAQITGNSASGFIGGARLGLGDAASKISVSKLRMSGNSSASGTAAMQIDSDGTYELIHATLTSNLVTSGPNTFSGALVVNTHSSTPDGIKINLYNSTIARNRADSGNEALAVYTDDFAGGGTPNALINIVSTILGNRDGTATQNTVGVDAVNAAKTTYTKSFIEGPSTGIVNEALACVNGTICGGNAYLVANVSSIASENGKYVRPSAGSLAINGGSNPLGLLTDAAGLPRVNGQPDMGAIELQPGDIPPQSACKLDMDNDNQIVATKEGLVLLRSMLGFTSATAVAGTGITQTNWDTVRSNLNANCGTNLN